MDLQRITGAGRYRSLFFRVLFVVGAAVAGTALAWLLSSATASAAEKPSVPNLFDTAVQSLDAGRLLGGDALPAAHVVPAVRVDTYRLVVPVVAVEQRIAEVAEHGTARPADPQVTAVPAVRAFTAPPVVAAAPVIRTERVVEHPVVVDRFTVTPSSAPVRPGPGQGHGPTVLPPFASLPNGACGHDGSGGAGGFCLGEGLPVISAPAVTRPGDILGQWVPAATGRQPGITPD